MNKRRGRGNGPPGDKNIIPISDRNSSFDRTSKHERIARLADHLIGGYAAVVTDASTRKIYTSDGTRYLHLEDLFLQNYLAKNAGFTVTRGQIAEGLERIRRHNPVESDFFSAPVGKLCMKNGVLDLKTRQLESHSPKYGFTEILDYEFDPKAICEVFNHYLSEATSGDARSADTFLEYGGYCLWGSKPWAQITLIMLGEKNTGKSTAIDVLESLIKPYTRRIPMASLLRGRFDTERLHGNRLNISEETPREALLGSDAFKNLITAPTLDVEPKGLPRFLIENRCKHVLSSNHYPLINDDSGGTTRRLQPLPFENLIAPEKRDPHLKDRLLAERPGILNRMLDHYSDAWLRKRFTVSHRAREVWNTLERNSCPVSFWLKGRVEILPTGSGIFTAVNDLYHDFVTFESKSDRDPLSYDAFSKRLASLQEKRHKLGGRSDSRKRGYHDLRLKG